MPHLFGVVRQLDQLRCILHIPSFLHGGASCELYSGERTARYESRQQVVVGADEEALLVVAQGSTESSQTHEAPSPPRFQEVTDISAEHMVQVLGGSMPSASPC